METVLELRSAAYVRLHLLFVHHPHHPPPRQMVLILSRDLYGSCTPRVSLCVLQRGRAALTVKATKSVKLE